MNKSPSFLRPDEVVVSPSDVAEDILTTAGAIALITLMEVTGVEHVWAGGRAVDDAQAHEQLRELVHGHGAVLGHLGHGECRG